LNSFFCRKFIENLFRSKNAKINDPPRISDTVCLVTPEDFNEETQKKLEKLEKEIKSGFILCQRGFSASSMRT
jgi:hypothetical protein